MQRRTIRRRESLLGAAAWLAGCNTNKPTAGFLGHMSRFTDRAQAGLLDEHRLAAAPGPGATTPIDDFPAYKIGARYPLPPPGWALEVSGMVARPLRLSLADLRKLPRTDVRVRHYCVEGWSAVASWHGVRVRDIVDIAGVDSAAPYVEFVSFELTPESGGGQAEKVDAKDNPAVPRPRMKDNTYTSSWDRASALHPQTILAYGMNGTPLGVLHGGPVRLYASVKLGYKMVKWLRAVRFLPHATGGYWEDMGYEWFAGV